MKKVRRERFQKLLPRKLRRFAAVVLLGPRQSGKSSLALALPVPGGGPKHVFDLERPSALARLRTAPEEDPGALPATPGLIVMDEVQREAALFPLLRPLLDSPTRKARYLLNESELAGSLGIAAPTVGRYIDLLEELLMIRRLPPYFANVGKRLTKSPRIYLRDCGALHSLLGIRDMGCPPTATPDHGRQRAFPGHRQLTDALVDLGKPFTQ
jgi:predicted AAA+ superfamily ATPase